MLDIEELMNKAWKEFIAKYPNLSSYQSIFETAYLIGYRHGHQDATESAVEIIYRGKI